MSRDGTVYSRGEGKDRRWYYVVDVAPRGAPQRRQRRKGGFRTKADAQRALHEVLSQVDRGTYALPVRQTLGQYLLVWHATLEARGLADTTIEGYERNIRNHVLTHAIADVQLQELRAQHFDELYAHLRRNGRVRGGALKNRTIRLIHNTLTKALNDAVRDGKLLRNEALLSHPPAPKTARPPKPRTWRQAELNAFLSSVEDDSLYPLWRLLAMTGLRIGEALALRWCDLDLDLEQVSVRGALVTSKKHGLYRRPYPKSEKGDRTISIDKKTVEVLRKHQAHEGRAQLQPVFVDPDTQYWWLPKTIWYRWQKLVKATSLPYVTLHGIRHTHASILARMRTNIKVVQERLGHTDPAFTVKNYMHIFEEDDAEAATSFAQAVDGEDSAESPDFDDFDIDSSEE